MTACMQICELKNKNKGTMQMKIKSFEGDFEDMYPTTFLLMSMGGWVVSLACADLGAMTPIGMSVNCDNSSGFYLKTIVLHFKFYFHRLIDL